MFLKTKTKAIRNVTQIYDNFLLDGLFQVPSGKTRGLTTQGRRRLPKREKWSPRGAFWCPKCEPWEPLGGPWGSKLGPWGLLGRPWGPLGRPRAILGAKGEGDPRFGDALGVPLDTCCRFLASKVAMRKCARRLGESIIFEDLGGVFCHPVSLFWGVVRRCVA